VLDCVRCLKSKRLQLLQQLVNFQAMHSMELTAVLRYAVAMTRPPTPPAAGSGEQRDSVPAAAAKGAAEGAGLAGAQGGCHSSSSPSRSSSGTAAGGRYPGDGFWTAVLSLATAAMLDSSNHSPAGLTVMAVDPSAVAACAPPWPRCASCAGPMCCPPPPRLLPRLLPRRPPPLHCSSLRLKRRGPDRVALTLRAHAQLQACLAAA
jgi:hypothetical protein